MGGQFATLLFVNVNVGIAATLPAALTALGTLKTKFGQRRDPAGIMARPGRLS